MSVEIAVVGILGAAQGFLFIPWVIGLIEPIANNILPPEPHLLPRLIARVCAFVCLLMTYLGLGLIWLHVLGTVSGAGEGHGFKIWLGASLVGMFIYLGVAKLQRTPKPRA